MITPHVVVGCTTGIIGHMSASPPPASIIIPTFREAPNIQPLVERAFAAIRNAGREAELIIVDDDSRDGTDRVIQSLEQKYPVRLITRLGERGLSRAVLAGFAAARFDRFLVMDGDLQHPPEMIPDLLSRLDDEECDFVIASRYVSGAEIGPHWPMLRRIGSLIATQMAKPLAPLSDPLSGFFAIRRKTWEQAAPLNPIGYKIALELYVKGKCRHPAEVPIHFAARTAGQSKLGLAEQLRYVRHLISLYWFRFPRLMLGALAIAIASLAGVIALVVPG